MSQAEAPKGNYGLPLDICVNENNELYKCNKDETAVNFEYYDKVRKCSVDTSLCEVKNNNELIKILDFLKPFNYVLGSKTVDFGNGVLKVEDPEAYKKYFENSKVVGKSKAKKPKILKSKIQDNPDNMDENDDDEETVIANIKISQFPFKNPIQDEPVKSINGPKPKLTEQKKIIIKNKPQKITNKPGPQQKLVKQSTDQNPKPKIDKPLIAPQPKKDNKSAQTKAKKKEKKKGTRRTITVVVGMPRKNKKSLSTTTVKAPRKVNRVRKLTSNYYVPQGACRAKHVSCKGHIIGRRQLNLSKVLNMSTERVNKYLSCNSFRI